MSVQQMREAVRNAYRSAKWKRKVDAYPDSQIIAIYHRLRQQNVQV